MKKIYVAAALALAFAAPGQAHAEDEEPPWTPTPCPEDLGLEETIGVCSRDGNDPGYDDTEAHDHEDPPLVPCPYSPPEHEAPPVAICADPPVEVAPPAAPVVSPARYTG